MRESMDSREAFTAAEEEAYHATPVGWEKIEGDEAKSQAAQEDKLGSEYEEWVGGVEAAEDLIDYEDDDQPDEYTEQQDLYGGDDYYDDLSYHDEY